MKIYQGIDLVEIPRFEEVARRNDPVNCWFVGAVPVPHPGRSKLNWKMVPVADDWEERQCAAVRT